MFYSVTFAKAVWSQITGKSTAHQKSPFCSQHNSGAVIEQMMRSTAFGKITAVYGQIDENGRFVRKIRVKSRCTAQNKKKSVPSRHEFSSLFSCVRGHDRSATHLVNQAQTNNKAHDKFVPRRDCACADHSRPSLSTALLSGWSSHLVLIGFRLTTPLSQAPLLGQDELTRRKRDLDTRGLSVRLHTLLKNYSHSKPYSCEGCLDCGLLNIRSSCRSTAKQAVQVQESGCLLRLQDI